jgi:hypothetical protein
MMGTLKWPISPSQHARAKGHADGDIRRQQGGGGLIRLDHDRDVEMADIRPSQYADGDIRNQRGGGDVMIRLDHDGNVEMADIRLSRHARTKEHAKIRGWKQSKDESPDTHLDRTTVSISKRYCQPT